MYAYELLIPCQGENKASDHISFVSLTICQLCKELMYKHFFLPCYIFFTTNHIFFILKDHLTMIKIVSVRRDKRQCLSTILITGIYFFSFI